MDPGPPSTPAAADTGGEEGLLADRDAVEWEAWRARCPTGAGWDAWRARWPTGAVGWEVWRARWPTGAVG